MRYYFVISKMSAIISLIKSKFRGRLNMKKISILILTFLILTGANLYAQEKDVANVEKRYLGLNIGLDYWSNYLWRGTYFYGEGGANESPGVFFPSVTWNILNSGFFVAVAAEVPESWLFDGAKSMGYYFMSVDFGVGFKKSFMKVIAFELSAWYCWYFNSEYEPSIENELSFLTFAAGITIEWLIHPFLRYTHDFYTMAKDFTDFYIEFGIKPSIKIFNNVSLDLGAAAGIFYQKSMDRSGFSDIHTWLGFTAEGKGASFSASINYILVPTKKFYQGDDMHRFYAKVGIGYTI
jgi:hypothetical protein